jgi:hypothetical protein
MWTTSAAAVLIATTVAASAAGQDATRVIDDASKAMGVVGLSSITFSGSAATGNFGQSRTISFGLASTAIRNYTRTIDFTTPASHATGATLPPVQRGAPAPPEPATLGVYDQSITPANPVWAQQMLIWTTPWGFLKGAAANNPTLKSQKINGVPYKVVTWSPVQKSPSGVPYKVSGYIDADNMVARVETWVEHPVLGDLHHEFFYTGYQSVNGLMVPAKISQRQVGMETFVVAITNARANPPELAQLMTPPPACPCALTSMARSSKRWSASCAST